MVLREADKSRFVKKAFSLFEAYWLNKTSNAMILRNIASILSMNGNIFLTEFKNELIEKIIKWVNSGAADSLNIDWNKAGTVEVLNELIVGFYEYAKRGGSRKSQKALKKDAKTLFETCGLEVVHEGEDSSTADIIIFDSLENDEWFFVSPLTHEGCVFMDSFQCGGAGATWCIGTANEAFDWKMHTHNGDLFMMAYNKHKFGDMNELKYMIQLGSDYSDEEFDVKHAQVWNQEGHVDFYETPNKHQGQLKQKFGHNYDEFVSTIIENTFCDGHWHQESWLSPSQLEEGDYTYDPAFSEREMVEGVNRISILKSEGSKLKMHDYDIIIDFEHNDVEDWLTDNGILIPYEFVRKLINEKGGKFPVSTLEIRNAYIDQLVFEDTGEDFDVVLKGCEVGTLYYDIIDKADIALKLQYSYINTIEYPVLEEESDTINYNAIKSDDRNWYGHEKWAQPEELEESVLREADKSRFINKIFANRTWSYNVRNIILEELLDAELIEQPYYREVKDLLNEIGQDQLIKWVNSGAADKYKIKWQHPDIETLTIQLIKAYADAYKTKSAKDTKIDPKKMFKDTSKFSIIAETDEWLYVVPKSYEACVFIDSFHCGGAGAKWCIGWKQSSRYWDEYINRGDIFLCAYNKKKFGSREKLKYMCQWKYGSSDSDDFECWKQNDNPKETLNWTEADKLFGGQIGLDGLYDKIDKTSNGQLCLSSIFNGRIIPNDKGIFTVKLLHAEDFDMFKDYSPSEIVDHVILYAERQGYTVNKVVFDFYEDYGITTEFDVTFGLEGQETEIEFRNSTQGIVGIKKLIVDWEHHVRFNGAFTCKEVLFCNVPDSVDSYIQINDKVNEDFDFHGLLATRKIGVTPNDYHYQTVDATNLKTKDTDQVEIIPGNRYNIDCTETKNGTRFVHRSYFQLGDYLRDTKDAGYDGFVSLDFDNLPTHIYLYNLFSDDMNVPFTLAPTKARKSPIYIHLVNSYVDTVNVIDEESEMHIIPETTKTHVGLRKLSFES